MEEHIDPDIDAQHAEKSRGHCNLKFNQHRKFVARHNPAELTCSCTSNMHPLAVYVERPSVAAKTRTDLQPTLNGSCD